MIRTVLALVAGFAVTAVASLATDFALMSLLPRTFATGSGPGTLTTAPLLRYTNLKTALSGLT